MRIKPKKRLIREEPEKLIVPKTINDCENGLCPSNCVNLFEPLNSPLKFDHKMSPSFIPIWDGHGPFFGNIICKTLHLT